MKTRDINPFGLRMPSEIRVWLEAQAAANRRSLNSELLVILEGVRRNQARQETAGDYAR